MEIEKVMEVQPVHTEHKEYASKGAANTGIGFGIAGTALGLLSLSRNNNSISNLLLVQ